MDTDHIQSTSTSPELPQTTSTPSSTSSPPPVSPPPLVPTQSDLPKNRFTKKTTLYLTILAVLLFAIIALFIYEPKPRNINPQTVDLTDNYNGTYDYQVDKTTYTPSPSPSPKTTLAPPGATDYEKQFYREKKASMAEAQAVQARIADTFGNVVLPQNIKFVHEETYKGIPIKWTASQPISAERLAWIKSAIDILPPYFYQQHPVTNIISATYDEIGGKGVDPESLGAGAYASGFNIFLGGVFSADKMLYKLDQQTAIETLFHEWAHVVQHYEILQTFTEEYLSIPGNLIVTMMKSPFTKDFAKTAGWEFQEDQYANSTYAILGTDAQSQKTTDYGKTKYVEDMAESAVGLMFCKKDVFSQARLDWWAKTTQTSIESYCQ